MNDATPLVLEPLAMPSDQEAAGRTFGDEEMANLAEVMASGTLTATKGRMVKDLARRFADMHGTAHGYACCSGTMALHAAISAVDPEPGCEIVTTPITDMGAITPILYQGAVPVFADVDPVSMNVTPASVEAALSDRTRAVIVTHLFGQPAQTEAIRAIVEPRGIAVIEDAAQAFLARENGRLVGTIGDIGCFSLQQGKHITCGEGGLIVTDDDNFGRRIRLFIDKAWGYGDAKPDHYFAALNGRMTELAGAVALAQLDKLEASVAQRQKMAELLCDQLDDLEGVTVPRPAAGTEHAYWRFCLTIDPGVVPGGPVALAGKLKEWSVASGPRYIQKPAFECKVIAEQRTFGDSRFPFDRARAEAVDYSRDRFAGAYQALERVLVLPWNERYQEKHVAYLARAIRTQHASLTGA